MTTPLTAKRILSADRRGSSWPVLVETDDGLRFTKLRGAGQGTGALIAEMVVASLAEALGLRVPRRSLVHLEASVPSEDRDGELRTLLDNSEGLNLGFDYLDGARVLTPADTPRVNGDDAAAIVWLDRFVLNPDRTDRNTNLLWWRNALWLIDHGSALGFQYEWSAVSEASPSRPLTTFAPHVLRERVADLEAWDEIFTARLSRDVVERAVEEVPDSFVVPLVSLGIPSVDAVRRRRAAYAAFLWKRLKAPRLWVTADAAIDRPKRGVPAWLR